MVEKKVDFCKGKEASNESKPASPSPSTCVVLALWALFVVNRALHPLIIDLSKDESGKLPYDKLSPIVAKCFLSVLICNVCALFSKNGWREGLRQCYDPCSIRVFAAIG